MSNRFWRVVRTKVKLLLRLRGDRNVIARGIAIGLAMNFLPTIGLGLPVVYWVAGLGRGHRGAAIISTMIIKPIFPLLYILNYITGELLLERHFVYTLDWHLAVKAGLAFFWGSAVNFTLVLVVGYYLSLWLLNRRGKGGIAG